MQLPARQRERPVQHERAHLYPHQPLGAGRRAGGERSDAHSDHLSQDPRLRQHRHGLWTGSVKSSRRPGACATRRAVCQRQQRICSCAGADGPGHAWHGALHASTRAHSDVRTRTRGSGHAPTAGAVHPGASADGRAGASAAAGGGLPPGPAGFSAAPGRQLPVQPRPTPPAKSRPGSGPRTSAPCWWTQWPRLSRRGCWGYCTGPEPTATAAAAAAAGRLQQVWQ
mmetsp:Transcript_35905/g.61829  ORF Transcript_35905/g.61829 Transcript_35905/m.61829 type:complete len:226 (+) Transcript_35905:55-732(+)